MAYTPRFKAQLNDPTSTLDGTNCVPTSTAMAMDRATAGKVNVTGGQVRARLKDPDGTPDTSGGTNLPQNIAAAKTWGVALTDRTGGTFDDLLVDLDSGRGAVLLGDYDQLRLCSSTYLGDHGIYVQSAGPTTAVIGDPLCLGFKTVGQATLRRYAEKLGAAKLTRSPQPIYYAVTPEDNMAVVITDPTPARLDLGLGTQLYATDGKTTLVKLSSGGKGLYSPAIGPTARQRYIVITTGGVTQLAVCNLADASVITTAGVTPTTTTTSAFNDGVTAAGIAALTAKR